jgi:hypothetical protein
MSPESTTLKLEVRQFAIGARRGNSISQPRTRTSTASVIRLDSSVL